MRLSQVLQRVVRNFNPVARFVLGTPLHALMSSRLMLLSFTGRKTGRSYTTPVSYVRDGNSLLVPGGGVWWKNLQGGPPARVRLRGIWKGVTPVVISEQIHVAELMQRMLAVNPAIAVFTGVKPGPDGRPDPVALEHQCQRGFVVVRLRLEDEDRHARPAA
jgi:deazaflavin-dependent oxidoreductase (nitroreductase family)